MIQRESIQIYRMPNCLVMMMASWNKAGSASNGMFELIFCQLAFVVVRVGPVPQQCESVAYWNCFCWVSMIRIGRFTRPTSRSRLGTTPEVLFRQLMCAGLVKHSWMERRAKSNVWSDPASEGIGWTLPRVGQGAR